jgi:hypothetical protein
MSICRDLWRGAESNRRHHDFQSGNSRPWLAVVAGTFLTGPAHELPLVSGGFGWIWVMRDQS